MSDVRPFEEYKEMIKGMGKEEMIKGLYDLSARVTKQENIIKEAKGFINGKDLKENEYRFAEDFNFTKLLEILEGENKQ